MFELKFVVNYFFQCIRPFLILTSVTKLLIQTCYELPANIHASIYSHMIDFFPHYNEFVYWLISLGNHSYFTKPLIRTVCLIFFC